MTTFTSPYFCGLCGVEVASGQEPCPCGFPCELYRRFEVMIRRWGIRRALVALVDDDARRTPGRVDNVDSGYVVDELTYRSYAYNRGYGVTPEHWARVFPRADVGAMEQRYQAGLDRQRHETIERRAFQPIWPFEPTR